MLELSIEQYLVQQVERNGGLCEKFCSPGKRGVPDRLVTWPGGTMELVEVKAPGKKPRPEQARDHRRRARLGVTVHVIDTREGVRLFCRRGNP